MEVMDRTLTIAQTEALARLNALVEKHQAVSGSLLPDEAKLRLLRRGIFARIRECEDEGVSKEARALVALTKEAHALSA